MPLKKSIKTSSVSDFEPKRKNPISLGSDSNIDNDLKPLTIGGISTGLEISKDTIASNVENFVTLKEKTQELNVSIIKGNRIPSLGEPQIIFQNANATDNSSGLWLNVFTDGTTFLKANDGQFAMAGTLMSFIVGDDSGEDFLIKSGTFTSNVNIFKVDNGGSVFLKEQSSATTDETAFGQIWVKDSTPNELYFRTDAGDDIQITSGTSLAGGGGGASALNDLSDVTYSSGDLTITGLDKIITTGDLDFLVAGGDLTFRANAYGSSYDGGVEFNITSNTVKFQRNLDTGLSGFTFDLGLTFSTIDTGSDGMYLFCGDNFITQTSSTSKRLKFRRQDSSFGDARLATSNEWSALTQFEDYINSTSGAGGTDTYGLLRGFLIIEDDTGFDNTFLMRLESSSMKSASFTNYGSTVAGTVKATVSNHGYVTGDTVFIEDTTDYNGAETITKIDDNNFYFTDTYTSDQSGKLYLSPDNVVASRKYGNFSIDKDGDIHSSGSLNIHDTADIDDYFKIETSTNGATSIATVDDNATAGHLTIEPDGDLLLEPTSENIKIPGDVKLIFGTNSANDHIYADPDASELYVAMNDSDVMTFMDDRVDVGVQLETNEIMLTEAASAVADRAGKGQLWVKNDTPNNLYFTNDAGNDVQITNGSSLAGGGGGGGGTDTWAPQWAMRWYTRYGYYYYPNATYGANTENWSSASTSALTSWNDAYNPCIIVPKDMTFKSYHLYGNFSSAQTYVLCIKTGTPSYGSAGNTSLTTLGSEQTLVVGTANIYQKVEETGLSISLSAGDIIIPTLRRTTSTTSSSYFFCEGVLNFIGEYT